MSCGRGESVAFGHRVDCTGLGFNQTFSMDDYNDDYHESNNNHRNKRLVVECLNLDRISYLPANVVDDILMRLSLRDAVRTSVLSKKWRHRWEDISQLVFDETFMGGLRRQHQPSTNVSFMRTIYEVLLLHSGLLRKFTLSLPGLVSCPEIDRLIRFLSKKDLQDFELCILSGNIWHKLPSPFFSFSQLRCLKLHYCVFQPPPMFKGFTSLIRLEFLDVEFAPDFFTYFIPNCPLLEELKLFWCSNVSSLEINAPSLKLLVCHGSYKSLCLKNAPLLAKLSIYNGDTDEVSKPDKETIPLSVLPSSLSAIEHLHIDKYFLKSKIMDVQDVWTSLPTSLQHLKSLRVHNLCLSEVEDLSRLLCLMRNAPHLVKLHFELSQTYGGDTNPSLQLLEAFEHSDFSSNQLLKVELHCFNGTGPEVKLVKFLLAKLVALNKIVIEPLSSMDANVQLKVLKEIVGFQRASAKAKIFYK